MTAPLTTRLLLARTTLQLAIATMYAVDWVADRLEREEDVPEFLRDEHRPLQVRGRPRGSA